MTVKKNQIPLDEVPSKGKIIIGGILFVSLMVFEVVTSVFPESRKIFSDTFCMAVIWLSFICAFFWMAWNARKPDRRTFAAQLQDAEDEFSEAIASQKEKYKNSASVCMALDRWYQKMKGQADNLRKLYRQEGETKEVLSALDKFDENLYRGWRAIHKGKNPLDSDRLRIEDLPDLHPKKDTRKVREL